MAKPPISFAWQPRTENQNRIRESILQNSITYIIGPAGTGKSFCAVMTALELRDKALKNGGIEKIVATRPLITSGTNPGALPGDLMEKCEPFMRAIHDIIIASSHPATQAILGGEGLEIAPLEFMRGLTFNDSCVILDEAQNVTPHQMQMFLTRLGTNSKMVVCGDSNQCDLKGRDGLSHAVELFRGRPGFGVVEMTLDDIQRAGIVRDVLIQYALDAERRSRAA